MNPLSHYSRHLRREVLLAIAAYAVALRTFELGFVLAVAAIASGYIAEGPRGRTLPRWMATGGAVLIMIWMVIGFLDDPATENTMSIVGRLACMLATLRLFEKRTPRDDRQVVVLSVVAVVASALYSFQLLFGLLVVVFAAQTIHLIMLNRLQSGFEKARNDRRQLVADVPVPPLELATGRAPVRQFRLLVLGCVVASFIAASMVFVIFPRATEGGGRSLGARTGFAPRVDLDRNDRIEQSNREVFTVQWSDPRGEAIQWPQPLLLRGAVLGRWDPRTRRWEETGRSEARMVKTNGEIGEYERFGSFEVPRTAYTQTVTMRSLATERVFARWAPVAISCDEARTFVFDPRSFEIEDSATGQIGRFSTYSLKVLPSPNQEELERLTARGSPAPPMRSSVFAVGEVREEAERILQEQAPELLKPIPPGNEEEAWRRNRLIAQVFTDHLRGTDFFYTLDLRRIVRQEDRDPIVVFLKDQRYGDCKYFASALCALCQSMGVEARMLTGFVAVEYDDALDHYVVRESNAHAWVEVRTGPWSWREFDPTSSEVLEELQASRRSWADDFRWIYDRFDFLWNSRIVAFNSNTQVALAEDASNFAGDRLRGLLASLQRLAARVNRYFMLGPAGYIWLGVVTVAVVIAFMAVASFIRRRRRVRVAIGLAPASIIREAAFYLDLLEAFSRAGCPKPAHVTPRTHLEAVRGHRPDLAASAAPLVDLFYEIRFGGRRLDATTRRRVEGEARAMLDSATRSPEITP